jgi:putative nucleotidyltransferase with HDIG domain
MAYANKKILYVESDCWLRQQIVMELEAEIDISIIETDSGKEAVKILKENNDISLVISAFHLKEQNGDCLYTSLRVLSPKTPFILHTTVFDESLSSFNSFYADNPSNTVIIKPEKLSVVKIACDLLELKSAHDAPAYRKIAAHRFLKFNNIGSDIFLRLGDNKYIKIINKDEMYHGDVIKKYQNKGCDFFYIPSQDYIKFCELYSNLIQSKLEKKKPLLVSLKAELVGVSFIHESVVELGIETGTVDIIDATIESSLHSLSVNYKVIAMLENMVRNKNYHYEHSLMCLYISIAIVMEMSWNSDATMEKLAIAAILHDISLENRDIVRMHDLDNEKLGKLPWRSRQAVKNHAKRSASIIDRIHGIPPDVSNIVLSHHELPDGSGFPRGLRAQEIPPLSCVFILAEEFTRSIFSDEVVETSAVIKSIEESYNVGNFVKPLIGLRKVFMESV